MNKPSETLRITLVQADLLWEDKKGNLQMIEEMIFDSVEPMEVVVLPEMFSTGFVMQPENLAEGMEGETVEWMKKVCSKKRIIVTGSIIVKEGDDYFNRLIWMQPNGSYGYYDKRHLFAYAGEDARYTGGNKRLIASVKGWRINLQICYDLRFPVWARQACPVELQPDGTFVKEKNNETDAEYDVLVYVANWPEKRSHAWRTLLQARAIENQCYVAGCNRVGTDGQGLRFLGDSMVINAMGEVIEFRRDVPAVFTCELHYSQLQSVREKLPFLRDADPFIIANSHP
jgi:omega-amidase